MLRVIFDFSLLENSKDNLRKIFLTPYCLTLCPARITYFDVQERYPLPFVVRGHMLQEGISNMPHTVGRRGLTCPSAPIL